VPKTAVFDMPCVENNERLSSRSLFRRKGSQGAHFCVAAARSARAGRSCLVNVQDVLWGFSRLAWPYSALCPAGEAGGDERVGRLRFVQPQQARDTVPARPYRDLMPATICRAWGRVRREVSMNIWVCFFGLVPNWYGWAHSSR
jgi:hypothetical protein